VARRVAGFEEIMRFWDINDVARWNEILDAQDDHEWLMRQAPPGGE
jgi:hypothetical protein